MTTQEAIEIMKLMQGQVEWDYPMEYAVAMDMAVDALQKRMPEKPMISINVYDRDLRSLYCPTCGMCIGLWNKRVRTIDMHNETNAHICAQCGRAIDCGIERLEE